MILYKYFEQSDHRKSWLEGHGKIYFSSLNAYTTDVCDHSRRDAAENTRVFDGQQSIKINDKSFIAEKITVSDDYFGNYISCFSTTLSDKLRPKFGKHVLKFDSKYFLEFLGNNSFGAISFIWDKIDYVDRLDISPSSPFRKLKKGSDGNIYEEEDEFRILMKIRDRSESERLIASSERFPLELKGLKKYFSIL